MKRYEDRERRRKIIKKAIQELPLKERIKLEDKKRKNTKGDKE